MPNEKAVKRAASRPTSIPRGLQDVSLTIRLRREDILLTEMLNALEQLEGFSRRGDGAHGALRGEIGWGAAHGHFSIDIEGSAGAYLLFLEVVSSSHGKLPKETPRVKEFLSIIQSYFVDPDRSFSGLLGVNFSLPLKVWSPTVPLPFTPPGVLDHIPGAPQISGLDFSFPLQTDDQPLIRAFITSYGQIDRLVVRFLLSLPTAIHASVIDEMLRLSAEYVLSFAREVESQ